MMPRGRVAIGNDAFTESRPVPTTVIVPPRSFVTYSVSAAATRGSRRIAGSSQNLDLIAATPKHEASPAADFVPGKFTTARVPVCSP